MNIFGKTPPAIGRHPSKVSTDRSTPSGGSLECVECLASVITSLAEYDSCMHAVRCMGFGKTGYGPVSQLSWCAGTACGRRRVHYALSSHTSDARSAASPEPAIRTLLHDRHHPTRSHSTGPFRFLFRDCFSIIPSLKTT